jgi:hypothetical protein
MKEKEMKEEIKTKFDKVDQIKKNAAKEKK